MCRLLNYNSRRGNQSSEVRKTLIGTAYGRSDEQGNHIVTVKTAVQEASVGFGGKFVAHPC